MVTKNPKTDGFDGAFKELSDDEMATRTIELPNKEGKMQSFTISQDGQFALWKVIPSKGKVPQELEGRYTTVGAAEKAIAAYIAKRDGL